MRTVGDLEAPRGEPLQDRLDSVAGGVEFALAEGSRIGGSGRSRSKYAGSTGVPRAAAASA